MLALINAILTTAPAFNKTGLVGFPINAILDWPMGHGGGFAAFLNDKVNAQFKKILNAVGGVPRLTRFPLRAEQRSRERLVRAGCHGGHAGL